MNNHRPTRRIEYSPAWTFRYYSMAMGTNELFWPVALTVAAAAVTFALRGKYDPTKRCRRCGYIVEHLPSSICPECGSDIRKVGLRRSWFFLRWPRVARFATIAVVWFLPFFWLTGFGNESWQQWRLVHNAIQEDTLIVGFRYGDVQVGIDFSRRAHLGVPALGCAADGAVSIRCWRGEQIVADRLIKPEELWRSPARIAICVDYAKGEGAARFAPGREPVAFQASEWDCVLRSWFERIGQDSAQPAFSKDGLALIQANIGRAGSTPVISSPQAMNLSSSVTTTASPLVWPLENWPLELRTLYLGVFGFIVLFWCYARSLAKHHRSLIAGNQPENTGESVLPP